MSDYTAFNRAKADRINELTKSSGGGWFSNFLTNIVGSNIKKYSKAGGLPGILIGFVVDKALSAIAGDTKEIGAASLLGKEGRDAAVSAVTEDAKGDITGAVTSGIANDIKQFANTYGLSDKEAKQAYFEAIRDKENWGDWLTGQDEFDFSTPMVDAMPTGPELTRSDKKLLEQGIKDIESEDIGAPTMKDKLLNVFGPKQGVVDALDVDAEGYISGGYQRPNILGNLISKTGGRKYLNGQLFTKVSPQDIIDFDIEDPEGYQEILSLIEDMETGN